MSLSGPVSTPGSDRISDLSTLSQRGADTDFEIPSACCTRCAAHLVKYSISTDDMVWNINNSPTLVLKGAGGLRGV